MVFCFRCLACAERAAKPRWQRAAWLGEATFIAHAFECEASKTSQRVVCDPDQPPPRVYEKGAERYKHVGRTANPQIVRVDGLPKRALGVCPNNLSDALKAQLLNEAIPAPPADPDMTYPKRLHVVYEGTIYRAETSTAGKSYHAFPYAGKLGKGVIAALAAMADRKQCRAEFDKWLAKHILAHGR